MPHLLSLGYVLLGNLPGNIPYPADIPRPFRHTDGLSGIEQVKGMGTLETVVICRQDQVVVEQSVRFRLKGVKKIDQGLDIGIFIIKGGKLDLCLMKNLAIGNALVPLDVIDAFHALEIHRDPLQAVGDFNRDRMEFNTAGMLKIGELGNFHTIQPDLPAKPACPKRR